MEVLLLTLLCLYCASDARAEDVVHKGLLQKLHEDEDFKTYIQQFLSGHGMSKVESGKTMDIKINPEEDMNDKEESLVNSKWKNLAKKMTCYLYSGDSFRFTGMNLFVSGGQVLVFQRTSTVAGWTMVPEEKTFGLVGGKMDVTVKLTGASRNVNTAGRKYSDPQGFCEYTDEVERKS